MTRTQVFLSVMVVSATFAVGWGIGNHDADRRIAQATYDYGKAVGFTLGSCETMQQVHDANLDSVWAQSPKVRGALTACRELVSKHGPGTTEVVQVP